MHKFSVEENKLYITAYNSCQFNLLKKELNRKYNALDRSQNGTSLLQMEKSLPKVSIDRQERDSNYYKSQEDSKEKMCLMTEISIKIEITSHSLTSTYRLLDYTESRNKKSNANS